MESRPELRFPAFRNRGFHSPELRFPVAGLRESFQPEYSCLSASALRGSATRNGWLSTTDGLALVERNTQRFPAERNGDAQYSGTMIPSGPEWRFPRTGISTSTEKAYGSSTSAPPTTFEIPWLDIPARGNRRSGRRETACPELWKPLMRGYSLNAFGRP